MRDRYWKASSRGQKSLILTEYCATTGQNHKYASKPSSRLTQQIAVRLTNWDTASIGYVEADLVMHCGASTLRSHICTVSATEVSSGWWEGEPIWGNDQRSTFEALKGIRGRMPFAATSSGNIIDG